MATIYVGAPNKYDLNWNIYDSLANTDSWFSSFLDPFSSAINNGINSIISGIRSFQQENSKRKKIDLDFLLHGDENMLDSEQKKTMLIVIAVVIIVVIMYLTNRKK